MDEAYSVCILVVDWECYKLVCRDGLGFELELSGCMSLLLNLSESQVTPGESRFLVRMKL